MGTTNSEAVVSISSIELHVFKSQLYCKKVQTKSTISKSLAKIDPVFKSGNKNLENKSTDALRKKKYISKVVGCFVGKKAHYQSIFFIYFEITTWRDLQCLPTQRTPMKQKWIYSLLSKSSYMKYIRISIERNI